MQPLRKCVSCNLMKEKAELFRVVKNKEGKIFVDETGKSQGRGAYICKNHDCILKAQKKNAFSHAFKCRVDSSVYDDLLNIKE